MKDEATVLLQSLVDASKRIVHATTTKQDVVAAEVQFDKALRAAQEYLSRFSKPGGGR